MTTRKQEIGRNIGPELAKLVEPSEIFVGANHKKLYQLESSRSVAIQACAEEWAKVMRLDPDKDVFWNRAVPQALFDVLEAYSPQCSIIAAEASLKQFGWKIERPQSIDEIAAEVTAECKAEMVVRDRLAKNGRNVTNNNQGIPVGSDLHLMEMLIKEIDTLRAALREGAAQSKTA